METLTIVCQTKACTNSGQIVNTITLDPSADVEAIIEDYGHPFTEADSCPVCKKPGVLVA